MIYWYQAISVVGDIRPPLLFKPETPPLANNHFAATHWPSSLKNSSRFSLLSCFHLPTNWEPLADVSGGVAAASAMMWKWCFVFPQFCKYGLCYSRLPNYPLDTGGIFMRRSVIVQWVTPTFWGSCHLVSNVSRMYVTVDVYSSCLSSGLRFCRTMSLS